MNEILECQFDPSQPKFLGGFKDSIHVKGWRGYEDQKHGENHEEVILVIRRPMFLRMMDAYLKQKIAYCERYQHYCGAMSSISCQSTLLGEAELYEIPKDIDAEPIARTVRAFKVVSFDPDCDMEHG